MLLAVFLRILSIDGQLYMWGGNTYGGIGDGTTTDRISPVLITVAAQVTPQARGPCILACGQSLGGVICLWCTLGIHCPWLLSHWCHHRSGSVPTPTASVCLLSTLSSACSHLAHIDVPPSRVALDSISSYLVSSFLFYLQALFHML